jgi:hypothetical protein
MRYVSLEQAVMAFSVSFPPPRQRPPEDFERWLSSDEHAALVERCAHRCGHGVECEDATNCPYCLTLEAWAAAGFPSEWPPAAGEAEEDRPSTGEPRHG